MLCCLKGCADGVRLIPVIMEDPNNLKYATFFFLGGGEGRFMIEIPLYTHIE